MKFEDKMQRIQEIAAQLEDTEVGLEESLKLYEEGIALVRECSKTLEEAEVRLNMLRADGQEE